MLGFLSEGETNLSFSNTRPRPFQLMLVIFMLEAADEDGPLHKMMCNCSTDLNVETGDVKKGIRLKTKIE